MKLMKTSQVIKDYEVIVDNVVFFAEGQIRYGHYDIWDEEFIQHMSDGSTLKFNKSEVEEWFRVLYK